MENAKPRIGIYGSVPHDSDVFSTIVKILGYDPFLVKEVGQDPAIEPYCGRAKTFGAHFTIYDIFTPTDYDQLIKRVKSLVQGIKQFDFQFKKFSGYVRGDYQGKSVYNEKAKTVLALDFDEETQKRFGQLHQLIVENIQDLRVKIEPEFSSELFKNTPELWDLIKKYGAPYVLKNYSPHLTVASRLDGSNELLNRLITHLDNAYGKDLINIKIPFDKIYIFEEIVDGEFAGYFKVIDEILLKK